MKVPNIKFNDGNEIPQVGFGLWQNKDEAECVESVVMAVNAGYRHFDTAQIYGNEQYLATGLKRAGLERKDTFITTKIAAQRFYYVIKSFEESLSKLGTDYVDLLLLHFPVTLLRGSAWKHLEDLHKAGKAKSIGVSNYTIRHLERLLKNCEIVPAVNQVEIHVFLQQPELLAYCHEKGIVVEAYSPLAHGKGIDDPELVRIGSKYHKTATQVMLRWCVENGTVPLPKSTHKDRIEQNIGIFDFKLDTSDMKAIGKLNKNMRTCVDPTHVP
jgi:diketogulonate reductase-like aldo/keto reductase